MEKWMNHLQRQDVVAKYKNYLTGEPEQDKTKQTPPTKTANKKTLYSFSMHRHLCGVLKIVGILCEKKGFADSV